MLDRHVGTLGRVRQSPSALELELLDTNLSQNMLLDSLVNRPNRIPERQRAFQAATHLPVYRRGKYSNVLLNIYAVSMVAGVVTTLGGIYAMVTTKPGK